jgi:hypothetical protein
VKEMTNLAFFACAAAIQCLPSSAKAAEYFACVAEFRYMCSNEHLFISCPQKGQTLSQEDVAKQVCAYTKSDGTKAFSSFRVHQISDTQGGMCGISVLKIDCLDKD